MNIFVKIIDYSSDRIDAIGYTENADLGIILLERNEGKLTYNVSTCKILHSHIEAGNLDSGTIISSINEAILDPKRKSLEEDFKDAVLS